MWAEDGGRFIAELVERSQTARDLAGVREEVLDSLQALVPCETIFWGHAPAGPTDGADHYRVADAPARAALERFVSDRERYDLPTVVSAVHATGGVAIDVEHVSASARDRLPLYADILRPAGIGCYLVCIPRFRGRLSSVICFGRHGPRARFVANEKGLMRSLVSAIGTLEAAFRASSFGDVDDERGADVVLAPREAQVANLIASGLQNKEIAAVLGTSPETVHKQSLRIYEKLGVSGRVQLSLRLRSGPSRFSRSHPASPPSSR
jgi:DNA-binding CsgD family transcriptional regulator